MAVHLLLGDPQDPCCASVRAALEARNCPTRILPNPLVHPSHFVWRLDNVHSASQLVGDGDEPLPDEQIAGVLVRSSGWVDPSGWEPADYAYAQAEVQAALLAWLWSLACPVVNRYPSATWYNRQVPLLFWQQLLRRCGLTAPETLVTNVEQEARAFGRRLASEGMSGAVYGPLTSDVRYLVSAEQDWNGLVALQRSAPVCLTVPHGATQSVCVVGERVVWEGEPSPTAIRLEPALHRFATAAGLAFVELALAPTSKGLDVIFIEPYPRFEHFGGAARQQIIEGLVQLLTAEASDGRQGAAQVPARSIP